MAQHDPLRMACGSRRVYQECKIVLWVGFCPPVSARPCYVPDGREMLEFHRLVLLVTHENNPVLGYASLHCSFRRDLEEGFLGCQCFGA